MNPVGPRRAEEEVAERVSELPPETRSALRQCCRLQERLGARGAASPRLPRPVHPAVRDHGAVRAAPETLLTLRRVQKSRSLPVLQLIKSRETEEKQSASFLLYVRPDVQCMLQTFYLCYDVPLKRNNSGAQTSY